MRNIAVFLLIAIVFNIKLKAQVYIDKYRIFGSADYDKITNGTIINDEEYLFVGSSNDSNPFNADDSWLVSLSSTLDTIYGEYFYGGNLSDHLRSIITTNDSSYIAVGLTTSTDMANFVGNVDLLIQKMDRQGNLIWMESYGGEGNDAGRSISSIENGYLILGSASFGGNISYPKGRRDIWLININENGELIWERSYGGGLNENPGATILCNNGGMLIVGASESSNKDVSFNRGGMDAWIFKIDGDGEILWEKTFGGSEDDYFFSVVKSTDGYIAVGRTESNDGDVTKNNGKTDIWVVSISDTGDLLWEKTFGGSKVDKCVSHSCIKVENGIVIAGYTRSNDGDISNHIGEADVWILKVLDDGTLEWELTVGEEESDIPLFIKEVNKNTYLVGGYTFTYNSNGDRNADALVFTIKDESNNSSKVKSNFLQDIKVYPNPLTSNELKLKTPLSLFGKGLQIEIFDVLGRRLLETNEQIEKIDNEIILNIEQIRSQVSGIYFLSVTCEEEQAVFKFTTQ